MQVDAKPFQSIWFDEKNASVNVINQLVLPFKLEVMPIKTMEDAYDAIKNMVVRGAPLIGVSAAYGLYLSLKNSKEAPHIKKVEQIAEHLKTARPTAVNLELILDEMVLALRKESDTANLTHKALDWARKVEQREIDYCSQIGDAGIELIEEIAKRKAGKPVNILTHCNAGWLACVDWGTATAPIYKAHLKGIPVHVWVDETRPRNQGAKLTAWELGKAGVAHTIIPDNTGGHLMQHNKVDMVIVGSDRTTRNGDVANKIGTYLKALAAKDNNVPFYVALPSTSIDFNLSDGVKNIPIEQRDSQEVNHMEFLHEGEIIEAPIMNTQSPVANYGFDVTPARLVSGLITERGVCPATEEGLSQLFPENK